MSLAELTQIKEMLQDFDWGETLSEMRANFEEAFQMPPHPTATTQEVNIDGILADWVTTPQSLENRAVIYLHGGGFIMGSRRNYGRVAADLAESSQAKVLLLEYRLAPEFPYPAAIEDTVKAYQWLLTQGFNPSQIAFAGDSAGGNLVISTLVKLKSAKITVPAAAWVASPYVNLTLTGETMTSKAEVDLMVSSELLETISKLYIPHQDPKESNISPIYADLSGLPPLLVYVGTEEILLDDALRLTQKAALCKVAVELKVWPDMIHCHHLFAPMLVEGRQAISKAGSFLQEHLS